MSVQVTIFPSRSTHNTLAVLANGFKRKDSATVAPLHDTHTDIYIIYTYIFPTSRSVTVLGSSE